MTSVLLVVVVGLVAGCAGTSDTGSGREGGEPGGGIAWLRNDLAQGQARAKAGGKKIFLYFGANY